jgi:hypothetical protein
MHTNKNLYLAQKWVEAFNEHQLENLLSLYDDDAQHYSPKLKIKNPDTNGFLKGKKDLQDWWQSAFNEIPSLHYKVTSLTANDDRVFMEYIRQVVDEKDLLIAEVLEIKDDKIQFSRVYHG